MLKQELRKVMRNRKRQFSESQLRELSLGVISRLMDMPRVRQAQTLLLYHSLVDEVDTHWLIDKLYKHGKTVLLPEVLPDGNMQLRRYSGYSSMHEGSYGIMEPSGEVFTDYSCIDVAIVPGMSFDTDGNRLGRGKGYYDRFLPKLKNACKIGICFPFQKVEHVPTGPEDVRMDEVV